MSNIILPGQATGSHEQEDDNVIWLEGFGYKGFFCQAGKHMGKYKMFAKSVSIEVDAKGHQIMPEFESDWLDYYTQAKEQIIKYINAYRGMKK